MPASNPYNPYFTTGMMPTTIMGHEHAALASSNPIPHSMSLAAATTTIHNAAQNQKRNDRIQVILFKLLSLLSFSLYLFHSLSAYIHYLISCETTCWLYIHIHYTLHSMTSLPIKCGSNENLMKFARNFLVNSTKTVSFSSGSDFIIATSNRLKCQMHIYTQTFVQRIHNAPTHLPVSFPQY